MAQDLTWQPVDISGLKTVHAKRMPGRFRTFKTYSQLALWLPFFLLPYLRWNGKQAILLDIEHSQFRCFNLTVLPDDIWMLSLVMLLAAMVLFAVTAVASRVWCGYFCFQTAWTDWFTWIEAKIEGNHLARRKLDAAPWDGQKLLKKSLKHLCWMSLAIFTGISFSIWFVDAYDYWQQLIRGQLSLVGWVVLGMFFVGTYLLAGFLRENTCNWLCPYSRIQGVMADVHTLMPSYDVARGEPRGKLSSKQGDCVDCYQCVQVCPTGVDIRNGYQLGCITCGLCVDACDSIMDKLNKPRGLIRYASQNELEGKPSKKLYQHTRVWVYLALIVLSIAGIVYGLRNMSAMTLNVAPERQPLFVQMSDGSIQNKYEFKVMNKTDRDMHIKVSSTGIAGQVLLADEQFAPSRRAVYFTVFVKVPANKLQQAVTPIQFTVQGVEDGEVKATYASYFNAPE